jgi:hypothetical protein
MLPDVALTVGDSAGQTGLHRSELLSRADITGHVPRPSIAQSREGRTEACLLEQPGQGCVSAEHWPVSGSLTALETHIAHIVSCRAGLDPVCADALPAVTVSTGNGDRVPQHL